MRWTTWNPGACRQWQLTAATDTLTGASQRFGNASSQVSIAHDVADTMESDAMSAWTSRAAKAKGDLDEAIRVLRRLAAVFGHYAETIRGIDRAARAAYYSLSSTSRPLVESTLSQHTVLTAHEIAVIIASIEDQVSEPVYAYDDTTIMVGSLGTDGGVESAVRTLAKLAEQRVEADLSFVAAIKPVLEGARGLFGASPLLPAGIPPGVDDIMSGFTDPDITWDPTPLLPFVATDDPLTPGENAQHGFNDCWLVSTINAIMETAKGRDFLRSGVKWDPATNCFLVRIFDHGHEVWVRVTAVLAGGATANGNPGIISLYEAALATHFGTQILNPGGPPSLAAAIVGNEPLFQRIRWDIGPLHTGTAAAAVAIGGSASGNLSIAISPAHEAGEMDFHGYTVVEVKGTPNPGQVAPTTIHIDLYHIYEIVDVKNGWIGLRNPWGKGNELDGEAQNAAGVFYISQADFDKAFKYEADAVGIDDFPPQ